MDDTPEEPEGGDPGPDESGAGGPDGPDAPLRGWIDPEDRLWRHPSEVASPGGTVINPPPRHPLRSAVMVLVGVGAVMAVVAWVAVLLSPASERPLDQDARTQDTAGGATLTTLSGPQNTVPASAEPAGHAMVELQATTPRGTVALVGVAVAEGGLVATMADPLDGARRVDVVGPGGKLEPASLVGIDGASDVALVNVPEDLPVAPFADDTTLAGGSPDLTLSFVDASGTSLALHCTPGSVTGVGTAITSGPADGMPSITTSAAPPGAAAGEPLLNAAGSVVGVLYDPQPGGSSPVTFLPSGLVVGVANDLRSDDKVVHGWLGVTGSDAPGDGGARIEQVQSGSPVAGRIPVGSVIVAVNAVPVRTMAELVGRLYVLPPGAPVALTVQKPTGTTVVDATLSGSS